MPRCIFCHNPATTREHAWPHWLLTLATSGPNRRVSAWFGANEQHRQWQGPGADITVKAVCHVCNNGWMSNLEMAAQPILTPMMFGNDFRVTYEHAATLSLWATKTAMVFARTQPSGQRYYDDPEHAHLKRALSPPNGTFVWLGSRPQGQFVLFEKAANLFNDILTPTISANGRTTVLALGHLVIQVLSTRSKTQTQYDTTDLIINNSNIDTRHMLLDIWPPAPTPTATALWPPPHTLPDLPSVKNLIDRFTPDL